MSSTDKIRDLENRISKIEEEISDLTQTKINLMMLKRDFQMKDVHNTLRDSYEKTMSELEND